MITRDRTPSVMETAFHRLEQGIDPPRLVPWRGSRVYRYETQSIEQALIQKLTRVISALHAADVLLKAGFVQEQGVIHRILDEINEDITFLAVARTNDSETPLHKRYLKAFFEDQLAEYWSSSLHVKGPDTPPRKSIRAYVKRILGKGVQDSNAPETVARAYGGYIHAASQNIMDLYGGNPPKFHLRGLLGTPRIREHTNDGWNYLYRSLISFVLVARAFGDKQLSDVLTHELDQLEAQMAT
jgi:hypothetical protein